MMDKILLAGFGGQGIMFIGKVLAYAGMASELELCWIPSYGPEMRGGTANCTVLLSDQEIYSPVIQFADTAILMNQPAYDKFLPKLEPKGTLVLNSSLVEPEHLPSGIKLIEVPASDMARELGNSGIANMICLGALLPHLDLIKPDQIQNALKGVLKGKDEEILKLNWQGIQAGIAYQ